MSKTTIFLAVGAAAFCCAISAWGDGPKGSAVAFQSSTMVTPTGTTGNTAPPAATPSVPSAVPDTPLPNAGMPNIGQNPTTPPSQEKIISFEPKWLVINGRVLQGELLRDTAGYVFKCKGLTARFNEAEIDVIASTKDGLLHERRKRIDDKDFHERFQLAKWALNHGMETGAIAELESLLRDQPNHEGAKVLLKSCKARREPMMLEGDRTGEKGGSLESVIGGYDSNAVRMFTSRVQLILLNKCGACHANQRFEGPFRLYSRKPITSTQTRRNFKAAEEWCDLRNPARSRLLEMAITPHGDDKRQMAPFGGPHDENYRNLRRWVFTLSKNWQDGFSEETPPNAEIAGASNAPAHRPGIGDVELAGKMKPAADKPGFQAAADDAPPARPRKMATKKPSQPTANEGEPKIAKKRPAPPTAPASSGPARDPFDPAGFNGEDSANEPPTKTPPTPPASPPNKTPANGPSREQMFKALQGNPYAPTGAPDHWKSIDSSSKSGTLPPKKPIQP